MWVSGRPRASARPRTGARLARTAGGAVLLTALVAGLVPGAAVASVTTAKPVKPVAAFVDGAWTLSYVADVQFSGPYPGGSNGSGSAVVTGTGMFQVKGGGISGTHDGAGTATSSITVAGGQTGPATLNLALDGPVAGTAARAVLQGDMKASGTVSVDSAGLSTSVELAFGGALGDGTGAPLSLFSAGCDRATGTWTVDVRPAGQASGSTLSGPATFVAVRTGDTSGSSTPAYVTQVSQLLSDADGLVGRIGSAPLDTAALDAIVDRSEALSATIPFADACDGQRADAGYSTLVGVEISRILSAARAQLTHLGTADLVALLGLGYRTGAIGSGATWSGAAAQERAFRAELDRRRTAAAAVHDSATVTLVTVADRQFGGLRPSTAAPRPARAVRGVAVISPSSRVRGRGARPVLSWPPVAGATQYRVVLLDAGRRPYWAWQGPLPSVTVGGPAKTATTDATAPGGGPRVTKGCRWSVAAFDATGKPVALSAPRPIGP